ncbi:hypothetical protein JV173_00495 [Acholeplasma equirhinis]|uniref:hypothetical protein n=1 Tax=Acholeplasma equirhinis TaxID=555393 RepID=UPI00197A82DB|nr:hypothetical protein [Acholeplasma equirhinis]MBN3489982.1 hypothetical protein [Acholeplasma equirhinis]
MKDFYLDNQSFFIQFNRIPCDSESNILDSRPFYLLLQRYLKSIKSSNLTDFNWILKLKPDGVLALYKDLLVWDYKSVVKNFNLDQSEETRMSLYHFTENFYDFWRKIERFGFFSRGRFDSNQAINQRLIDHSDMFSNLVLKLYRTISQKILNKTYNLLRQLPAGTQANLSIVTNPWTYDSPYTKLPEQRFVSSILIRPPLMIYSKSNTRTGMFKPVKENPLESLNFNKNDYIVSALKIGPYLSYVYIHTKFLKYAVTLGSLFEAASYEEFKDKKPDLIYIYGIHDETYDGVYHHDTKNNIHIGFVSLNDKNDYFGYVKKMLLTLYNVRSMNEGKLPIHGAMFKLKFTNKSEKNVVIIGDSGAGKSETIEALRVVGSKVISSIDVVYDDMGVFYFNEENLVSSGSEIGAFVRLDDLDQGYAYKQIDRAVFLNPNQVNSRVVIPASTYDFIMKKHKVDLVLYANNYEETKDGLEISNDLEEIVKVFEDGARKAKGTTSEIGMTKSFFANPFGPAQHQDIAKPLLNVYFKKLFDLKIPVGVLYTKLAVSGYEQKGPHDAATKLLEYLTK